jgi:hypothetical protein
MRILQCFLKPLGRMVLAELVGEPGTLIVESTLFEVLHPRQFKRSAGFEGASWVRWGSFAVYGVKLHLLCSTNRVPLSYELKAANVAHEGHVRDLLAGANLGEGELVRKLLGDLAYRSGELAKELTEGGSLHSWLLHQSIACSSSRTLQGPVGTKTSQHLSRRADNVLKRCLEPLAPTLDFRKLSARTPPSTLS